MKWFPGRLPPPQPVKLPPRATTGPGPELLTREELELMDVLADVANRFALVIGNGVPRTGDVAEAVDKIHALQRMVMAQAAARRYPDRFRRLGLPIYEPPPAPLVADEKWMDQA